MTPVHNVVWLAAHGAARGMSTRAAYRALSEEEQREVLGLVNEPCSGSPWLTPAGQAVVREIDAMLTEVSRRELEKSR